MAPEATERPDSDEQHSHEPESSSQEDANGSDRNKGDKKSSDQPSSDEGKDDKSKEKDSTDDKDDKDKKPSKLKDPRVRLALIIVGIVVLILLIFLAIHWWVKGRFIQSTNDAYIQADQISVSPRISGYVQDVLVSDNQSVTAGQVLLHIDSREYAAKTEQARGQVAEGQASYAEAQANLRQQQAQIAQAQAELAEKQKQTKQYLATAEFDASQVRRYQPLAEVGAEKEEKLAQVRSDAAKSAAQVQGSRDEESAASAKVASSRMQIGIYEAKELAATAKIQEGQAQLAQSLVDTNATTVTSPIQGRVGDKTVRVGQYLQAGTRVMTVVPIQNLYLKANFKETQIGLMRVGQPASIKFDALSDEEIHGEVESFSPGTGAQFSLMPTDNATGNFTKITQRVSVRIRIDAGPEARKVLIPGLSATVKVDTIGAKSDTRADKNESKDAKDTRKQETKQEDQQNTKDHSSGAGHE